MIHLQIPRLHALEGNAKYSSDLLQRAGISHSELNFHKPNVLPLTEIKEMPVLGERMQV